MASLMFPVMTDAQKLEAAELLQRLEAIDAALAQVQNQRAAFEQKAQNEENFLRTERMKAQVALRALRAVQVVE